MMNREAGERMDDGSSVAKKASDALSQMFQSIDDLEELVGNDQNKHYFDDVKHSSFLMFLSRIHSYLKYLKNNLNTFLLC